MLSGGEKTYPFTAQVQSSTRDRQNLNGEVVGRGLLPSWLLAAVLVFFLACACAVLMLMLTQGGLLGRDGSLEWDGQATPVPAVTIDADQPEFSLTQPPEAPTQAAPQPPGTPPAATATPGGDGIEVYPGHSPEEPIEIKPEPPSGG